MHSLIFDPAQLPSDEASLSHYGTKQALIDFYSNEVTTEFYASSPQIDGYEVFAEWRLFKRALATEVKALKKLTHLPKLQEVKRDYERVYRHFSCDL